jgi:uncharacterized protein (TIGR00290 family)
MTDAPRSDAPTPVLLSWSGGKDAAWTLHRLRADPDVDVVGLLTSVNAEAGRVAMHGIRREVLRAQAEAVALPLIEAPLPWPCPDGAYEAAFADALAAAAARWPGLRTIAFGDLFLEDVRAFREALCARLGWATRYPLWGEDTAALARAMLAGGLRARLCCVDTTQLDARFAGAAFDAALLDALPTGVDPCGERGEFHTLVHDGPMFAHPLAIAPGDGAPMEVVLRDGRFAFADAALA